MSPASSHATMFERHEDANGQHSRRPIGVRVGLVDEGTEACIVLVYEISPLSSVRASLEKAILGHSHQVFSDIM